MDEWNTLIGFVGNDGHASTEGKALKAISGWWEGDWVDGNGTDDYGFSGMPGGYRDRMTEDAGLFGYWWTSTEYSSSDAYSFNLTYQEPSAYPNNYRKWYGHSVRCVRDSE